jgi:hypothetical protein
MKSTRAFAIAPMFALALFGTLPAASDVAAQTLDTRSPARHFNLVNATFDSVTSLAIAPVDSDAFHDVMLGEPLQGGLTSMTFDVPDGGCMRNLRVTFRDHRTTTYPNLDVCRFDGLRLRPQDRNGSEQYVATRSGR